MISKINSKKNIIILIYFKAKNTLKTIIIIVSNTLNELN
jgi:hypothetical protein